MNLHKGQKGNSQERAIFLCAMRWFVFLFIIGFDLNLTAQSSFQKSYGGNDDELTWAIQTTRTGEYVVAGFTLTTGQGGREALLIKIAANGDTIFTKTYGNNLNEWISHIDTCTDGGYIMAGTRQYDNGRDFYVIRTNEDGDTTWTKAYGSASHEEAHGVQQTNDGGFIILGQTRGWGQGNTDFYLVKIDPDGNIQWTKTYGGTGDDVGLSIQQTTNGGYIMLGYSTSFGAGGWDLYAIKTNSTGDTTWTKTYGGNMNDVGYDVLQTPDGGYIFAGNTQSYGQGERDVLIIKTDATGNIDFAKTYGSDSLDVAGWIGQTMDGGYIVAGSTKGFGASDNDVLVLKTDNNGNLQWDARYGGTGYDAALYATATMDDGILIAARTTSFAAQGLDSYLLKISSDGNGCNDFGVNSVEMTVSPQTGTGGITTNDGNVVSTSTTNIGFAALQDTLYCLNTNVSIQTVNEAETFRLYPNPTSEQAILEFDYMEGNNYTLQLYDTRGRLVQSISDINSGRVEVDRDELPNGLYLFRLLKSHETQFTGKLNFR